MVPLLEEEYKLIRGWQGLGKFSLILWLGVRIGSVCGFSSITSVSHTDSQVPIHVAVLCTIGQSLNWLKLQDKLLPFEVPLRLLSGYRSLVVRLVNIEVDLISQQQSQHSILLSGWVGIYVVHVLYFWVVCRILRESPMQFTLRSVHLGAILDLKCVLKWV